MKVLQIGKYYSPYKGGIETVVQNLSEGLVQQGNKVSVICANTKLERENDEIKGVDILRLPRLGVFASQPLLMSARTEIKRHMKSFDLLHFHGPNPLIEMMAMTLPKTVPWVLTYHSDIIKQKILGTAYKPFLKKFLERVDAIVVASKEAIETSPILPEYRKKCHVIPFGISEERFLKNKEVEGFIEEYKKSYSPYALFTGRLVSYKGVDVLLAAWKEVEGKLVLVGNGPLKESLLQQAKNLGIEDKVFFLGHVGGDNEFSALFHSCEFFILPSITRAEAFGMVMLEAMACSKPIISTSLNSGVRSVNEHETSGFQVEPGNSVELAERANQLFKNNELREKLSLQSRQRFESKFTVEVMVKSYSELYGSI